MSDTPSPAPPDPRPLDWRSVEFWREALGYLIGMLVSVGVFQLTEGADIRHATEQILAGVAMVGAGLAVFVRYWRARKGEPPAPPTPPAQGFARLAALALLLGCGAATAEERSSFTPEKPRQTWSAPAEATPRKVTLTSAEQRELTTWQLGLFNLRRDQKQQSNPEQVAQLTKLIAATERLIALIESGGLRPQQPANPPIILLPIQGQPKQELPIAGAPRQELPTPGVPHILLPKDGPPIIVLPNAGGPKQELPPAAPTPRQDLPVSPGTPPAGKTENAPPDKPGGFMRYTLYRPNDDPARYAVYRPKADGTWSK